MRRTITSCAILVLLIGTADAEQCSPGALGVSRTLVVDPNEHSRVGSMQYPETLPLNDHEIVLSAEALAVGSAGAASTRPSKRRGIVGSAGVAERGKGTGWIVWEPGRSRSRPRASAPADRVAG